MKLRSLLHRQPTNQLSARPVVRPEDATEFDGPLAEGSERENYPGYDYSQYAEYCQRHQTLLDPEPDLPADSDRADRLDSAERARRGSAQESLERLLTPGELARIRGQRR